LSFPLVFYFIGCCFFSLFPPLDCRVCLCVCDWFPPPLQARFLVCSPTTNDVKLRHSPLARNQRLVFFSNTFPSFVPQTTFDLSRIRGAPSLFQFPVSVRQQFDWTLGLYSHLTLILFRLFVLTTIPDSYLKPTLFSRMRSSLLPQKPVEVIPP